MELDLLEKTTFWIDGADLAAADLGGVAAAAAAALGLAADEVMVVDVRPGVVAFDVLRRAVAAQAIVGKEREVLRRVGDVAGVRLDPRAAVHSEGVLGFIALDPAEGERVLRASRAVAEEVHARIARRAIVFASGSEVRDGKIRDTNSPFLLDALRAAGFEAEFGGILDDDRASVVGRLEDALGRGYGLVVTTGGVGAEDKDHNVEAVLRIDPAAATPWILRFAPDMRRHHKEGVRIAVGRAGASRIVTLPGPHEEVRLAAAVLVDALARGAGDDELAGAIAGALRARWQERFGDEHPRHDGEHPRHDRRPDAV